MPCRVSSRSHAHAEGYSHADAVVDGLPAAQILRRLRDFINRLKVKTFSLDIAQLVSRMLDRYAQYGKQHTWLLSSGNLQMALANLIRTKDCFVDTPPFCSFRVHLNASIYQDLRIKGEVEWTPPYLAFGNLETTVLSGSQCHVQPRFTEPSLHQGYPQYPFVYEHRIGCEDWKVNWDNGLQGFRCRTSKTVKGWSRIKAWNTPDGCGYITPIDVQTVAVKHFPDDVKFERTFRVRIELTVFQGFNPRDRGSFVQWYKPTHPSGIRDVSNGSYSAGLPKLSKPWEYDLRDGRKLSLDCSGFPTGSKPSTTRGSRTISWYSSVGPLKSPMEGRHNACEPKPIDALASSRASYIRASSAFQSIPMADCLGFSHGTKREASASFERPEHLKRSELWKDDRRDDSKRIVSLKGSGHRAADNPLSIRKQRVRDPVSGTKDESKMDVNSKAKANAEDEPKPKHVYGPVEDLMGFSNDNGSRESRDISPLTLPECLDRQYYADPADESICVTPALRDAAFKLAAAAHLVECLSEPAEKRHDSVWSAPPKQVDAPPHPESGSASTATPLSDDSEAEHTCEWDEFLQVLPSMLACQRSASPEDACPEKQPEEPLQETPRPVYHRSKQSEELLDQRKIQGNYESFLEAKQEKELERLKMRLAAQRRGSVVNAPHNSDQEAFEAEFLEDARSSEVSAFESSERWGSVVSTPSVART